jgi:hypothetical protein
MSSTEELNVLTTTIHYRLSTIRSTPRIQRHKQDQLPRRERRIWRAHKAIAAQIDDEARSQGPSVNARFAKLRIPGRQVGQNIAQSGALGRSPRHAGPCARYAE